MPMHPRMPMHLQGTTKPPTTTLYTNVIRIFILLHLSDSLRAFLSLDCLQRVSLQIKSQLRKKNYIKTLLFASLSILVYCWFSIAIVFSAQNIHFAFFQSKQGVAYTPVKVL